MDVWIAQMVGDGSYLVSNVREIDEGMLQAAAAVAPHVIYFFAELTTEGV